MHVLSSISLLSSLFAFGSAVPTLTERSTKFCPDQSYLTGDVQCSSGFIGCVAYEKGSDICNGPKRFFNDCSGDPRLGSFFNCANGFKGCSTNPRICDSESPSPNPGGCAAGFKWYICASNGFAGCSNDPQVCDAPKSDPTSCSNGSSFYVCASNGFRGCSTNPNICDTPQKPTSSATVVVPGIDHTEDEEHSCTDNCNNGNDGSADKTPTCPKGTWYVRPSECSSGFVGCTSSELGSIAEVCDGEKRFWGSCPAKHGNYYNCANGFVGCTTDVGVCDKKRQ